MDFKDYYNVELVEEIIGRMLAVYPNFNASIFRSLVVDKLSDKEMKQRVDLLATALFNTIGLPYLKALELLLSAMDEGKHGYGRLTGFSVWVISDIIVKYGLQHPQDSIKAIYKITKHFTGEFAIRPFLQHHREYTLTVLNQWVKDESEDVRRLVSEGIRPKLPWAVKVDWLVEEPKDVLSLLNKLYDDDSEYVRRSVANNLNDISKTHPDLVVEALQQWQIEAKNIKQFDWLLRHACRSMVKDVYPDALALQGYVTDIDIQVESITVSPKNLMLGDKFTVDLMLTTHQDIPQPVLIDLHLISPGLSHKPRERTLKWCRKQISAKQPLNLTKSWVLKNTTVRQEQPGSRQLTLLINGKQYNQLTFIVQSTITSP